MTDSTERTSGAGWLPFILLLPALLYVGFWYDRLPAVVPVHFNIQGTADGYGSKQVLLLLPLLGLVLAGLLAFVTGHPEWANFPVRVTDDNRPRLYALYRQQMAFMGLALAGVFATLSVGCVEAARSGLHALPGLPVLIGCLVLLLGGTVYFLVAMVRNR